MWCRSDARLWQCFKLLSFRGVTSDTRLVHSIPTLLLLWITCPCASWVYLCDLHCDYRIILSIITICYIIPVFIMFASTFKVLTGLSLAIVLARFLARRGALRWQPRSLRNDDSSLAKIGVILVGYSCGKWSPIDADEPQTASAINH